MVTGLCFRKLQISKISHLRSLINFGFSKKKENKIETVVQKL